MWQLFVTCRKRPNLIMALNNVCLMVSFLLVIKSLKTMGSQDVKRSHQRLWFELGAQSGGCVCVCVFKGTSRGWGRVWRGDGGTLWNEAHHFKGVALREQVGSSLGNVRGQLLCSSAHVAGQQMRGAGRSKGNLKITGHPQSVPLN